MTVAVLTSIVIVLFFAVMLGIGFYCRKHATNVDGFVLGGRAVGPWLTAFAFGTSYFPPSFSSDTRVSSDGTSVWLRPGSASETR